MPIKWGDYFSDLFDLRSPIQKFLDSAQSIEFQRADVVATNISRSGRLITQTRNSVKPWTFKVVPIEYMPWTNYRDEIEQLFIRDRHTEWEIKLGGNSGSAWISEYMGDCAIAGTPVFSKSGMLAGVTMISATGNTLLVQVDPLVVPPGTTLFKSGDILQPAGNNNGTTYRYPYVAVFNTIVVEGTTQYTITLNRGFLHQEGYGVRATVNNQNVWTFGGTNYENNILVGNACHWSVILTSLPGVQLLPGKLVHFTGEVSLMEVVK